MSEAMRTAVRALRQWRMRVSAARNARTAFPEPEMAELAAAVAAGEVPRIQRLAGGDADGGLDINARGQHNANLLVWAMLHGSQTGFRALLEAGADPEQPAVNDDPVILMAAQVDDPIYLEILLDHGVDPSSMRGRRGVTPLMAAFGAHTDAQCQLLLHAGADVNRTDQMGQTALFYPCGHDRILQLLQAGADPRHLDPQGCTFQSVLRMLPERLLSEAGRERLDRIDAWLAAHDVPIEPRRS